MNLTINVVFSCIIIFENILSSGKIIDTIIPKNMVVKHLNPVSACSKH